MPDEIYFKIGTVTINGVPVTDADLENFEGDMLEESFRAEMDEHLRRRAAQFDAEILADLKAAGYKAE